MGLRAVLAVRPVNTTIANTAHSKHSYKLRDIEITRANQVYSTDITYRSKGNSSHKAWSKLCA